MQIEVAEQFTGKLIKNGGSLQITIPHFIILEYDLASDDWIKIAYIKKVEEVKRGKHKIR